MAFWNRKRKRKQATASVTHVVNNYGPVRDRDDYTNMYVPPVVPLFDGVDTSTPSRDCAPSPHESYMSHESGSYDSGSSYSNSGSGSDSGGSCGSD